MLTGALIGGVVGLITAILIFYFKQRKFRKLVKTVHNPEYAALYHYASQDRYKRSMKFFDSYGLLYVEGKNLFYKAGETEAPLQFDLSQCTVQQEQDWRKLKWFSISTPVGEKHYFNSHKMGAFINNSEETLKGLSFLQARTANN